MAPKAHKTSKAGKGHRHGREQTPSDSQALFLRPSYGFNFTEADFDDIVTMWGQYNTPELVKSSPFYTSTRIHTDPGARDAFPVKAEILSRTVHAAHPIPRMYLREMDPESLHDLAEKLEEDRWEIDRGPAFTERVKETLSRIDDALEYLFQVELPGSRLFSGREPKHW